MIFRSLFHDVRRVLAALPIILVCAQAGAKNVILHLRGGDRVTGVLVSENTNTVTISTPWTKELTVPVAEIERREVATSTNTVLAAPTAIATHKHAETDMTLAGKAAAIAASTNSWRQHWKGEVSLGTDFEQGLTDHNLAYGRAKLNYAHPYESDPKEFFRNAFAYDAEYGKTDGVLSDNRMSGSSKTDVDVSPKHYVYNLGAAGYDKLRLIDLHYEDGPGAGYHLFAQTNFSANLELGANYQVDNRSDNTKVQDAFYRLAQDVTWKITKQLSLTEKYEYFPRIDSLDQYRMRFESNLSCALIYNFCLNFTVVNFYDTHPAATVPNSDLQFRTSVGWKF
jgi:putative salt-induced outer membrane protein YdiY